MITIFFKCKIKEAFLPDPTVPAKYISFQNLTTTFPLLKERDNKYKCSLHKIDFI